MPRVIKSGVESTAGVVVSDNTVKMYGDKNNLFYTDETGVYIVGPVSITAQPENIKIASMFNFPTAYEMMVPSTVVTPRSMLVPSQGMEGFANISSIVAKLFSELPGI